MNDIDIRSGLSREERLRLEKIDRLDSNKTRKKVIIAVVTAILVLFFVLGTALGAKYILSYEGTQALPAEEIAYPEYPSDPEGIISSFKEMLRDTKSFGGVKLNVGLDVNIPDDSITLTGKGADSVRPYFDYIKDSFVRLISDEYNSVRYSGTYGEDFSEKLFDTNYLAHSVDISSAVNAENENELKYFFDYYEQTLLSPGGYVVFEKIFDVNANYAVKNALLEKTASMVKADKIKTEYTDFIMTVSIDRLKGQLNSISQKQVIAVTLPLTFIGEYEELGSLELSFTLELNKTYSFTRADFYFTEDVFYIEKGSSDEFRYKVISDESPADVVVTLTSSAPEVLSVDGSFYKGEAVSEKPVTVTGSYTYNGITYEDTCIFYVRVPVSGVKVSKKEISLKIGSESLIDAEISPDEATIRDVFWFTSDENIVKVGENGEITAVSEGTAEVYCITLDGNFRSSCTVTVYK